MSTLLRLPLHIPLNLNISDPPRYRVVYASVSSTPQRRTRRKKQQQQQTRIGEDESGSAASLASAATSAEKLLRLVFMEELMERARNADVSGVSDVIYDMIAAGLTPGPRTFHGLVVSHVLNRDEEGAVMHFLFPFL